MGVECGIARGHNKATHQKSHQIIVLVLFFLVIGDSSTSIDLMKKGWGHRGFPTEHEPDTSSSEASALVTRDEVKKKIGG
jgi:hypothetical protein